MADWKLWAAAAAVLVVAGWLVRRRLRAGRPGRGEIWWAEVPYARGEGSKLRPCLVVGHHGADVVVLKITSQDKSHRRDHVLIPTRRWDPRATHDSYLNLGEPIEVRPSAFQRRAGRADPGTRLKVLRHRFAGTRRPARRS